MGKKPGFFPSYLARIKKPGYSTDTVEFSCLVVQQVDTTCCVSELENVARRVTGSAFLTVKLIAVVTMRPVTSSLSGTILQTYLKMQLL